MKKVIKFMRSMKFGIILLVLISLLSAGGSLVTQNQTAEYYEKLYPGFSQILITLGITNIYKSWYFVVLVVLLCINLTLCSVIRIKGMIKSDSDASMMASKVPDTVHLNESGVAVLKSHLSEKHCKEHEYPSCTVYSKNSIGKYGSFITHLAILLTVIFGAAVLYTPTVVDQSCYPGKSLTMDDGTRIKVNSFRIEDSSGRLDYTSNIQIISPDGKESEAKDISVNHPFSFMSYKVYQQTYGTAGSVTVSDSTGASDDFILDDVCFLSADDINGVWFEALYAGYMTDESGNTTLITNTSGSYPDPIYVIQVAENGVFTPYLMFPGESVTVGDLTFTFNDPIEYPGLRIKHTPPIINTMLIISFCIMIGGLFITFFMPPTLVKVDENGYSVCGPKPESMRIELESLLNEYRKE